MDEQDEIDHRLTSAASAALGDVTASCEQGVRETHECGNEATPANYNLHLAADSLLLSAVDMECGYKHTPEHRQLMMKLTAFFLAAALMVMVVELCGGQRSS